MCQAASTSVPVAACAANRAAPTAYGRPSHQSSSPQVLLHRDAGFIPHPMPRQLASMNAWGRRKTKLALGYRLSGAYLRIHCDCRTILAIER